MQETVSRGVALSLVCAFWLAGCEPVGEPIVDRVRQESAVEVVDGGSGGLNCEQSALLPGTIALYCFEEEDDLGLVSDSKGDHDGTIVGDGTRRVDGPLGLGQALRFAETNGSTYVEIPDSEAWDLDEGSISFWLKIDACSGETRGIVSRDARLRQRPGHLGVRLSGGCEWSVSSESTAEQVQVQSIKPLVPDRWSQVTVNFGAPDLELYLDGRLMGKEAVDWGIAGNRNPWVIGADLRGSDEGSATPPTNFLRGAAVDLLRISSERVTFSDLE